jgi:hypothetical protein
LAVVHETVVVVETEAADVVADPPAVVAELATVVVDLTAELTEAETVV